MIIRETDDMQRVRTTTYIDGRGQSSVSRIILRPLGNLHVRFPGHPQTVILHLINSSGQSMLVDCLMDDAVNLLMLVREVIYYIDYPKRRSAGLRLSH